MPIGGGGLIAGIAAYVKRLRPEIKVIGVEPVDADAMYQSLRKNRRIKLAQVGLFADGVAVRRVGEETFRLCRSLVDEVVLVSTDEICSAIQDALRDAGGAIVTDSHNPYHRVWELIQHPERSRAKVQVISR